MIEIMQMNYYIEGERVCTKIGGHFSYAPTPPLNNPLPFISGDVTNFKKKLRIMVDRGIECSEFNPDYVTINPYMDVMHRKSMMLETNLYFYHPDHLGSSSFITDATGYATQHLQYLPFGEPMRLPALSSRTPLKIISESEQTFVDQQNGYDSRYTFSAKELDDETQYSYFGARYYDSDLSVWLSVDPMSDMYPHQSPYMYCSGNPVMRIDPNGMNDGWYVDETGTIIGKDKNDDDRLYFVTGRDAVKVKEDNFTNGVDQSELQDAREIPSFEQRQKLKECYDKGEKDPTHEYGMLINTTEDNSAWSYALFKGDPSDPYAEDGHKGRVRFGDPSTIIEMGGDLNGVKETKYQAHTHNVKPTEWPVRAVPPTPGADKVSPGVTGLVFETNVGRVYIHSSITKRRDMDFMSSSVFFGSFVYNGISY